jgi:hypothetical protein
MSELKMSGPLFNGQAAKILSDCVVDISDDIGRQGVNDIKTRLGAVLQNPTGRYERSIQTDRQRNDLSINDSGIVYGPWLEGVSSRNQSSRFKGYATFRQVTQQLDVKAGQIATSKVAKCARRVS